MNDPIYPIHNRIPDVSKYQGRIDWQAVAGAVDFIIIRVQDNQILDSELARNIRGAKGNHVPYALYAYFRAADEASARMEADLFYDRAVDAGAVGAGVAGAVGAGVAGAGATDGPILWYIDVEKKTTAWPRQRKAVLAYAERLRARGARRVGLYTYNAMYPYLKAVAGAFDDVWIAHYGKNIGVPSGYPSYPCGLHQYTSMAGAAAYKQYAVPGIRGRVDLNRLTGAKPLSWYTGRDYGVQPAPEEPLRQVRVTGRRVNVRSGPGKRRAVLGVVGKGMLLTRSGEDHDGWVGVLFSGRKGYISARYARARP